MDKKELIEFLKDSLKIRLDVNEKIGVGIQLEAYLELEVDGEEIEIDKCWVVLD